MRFLTLLVALLALVASCNSKDSSKNKDYSKNRQRMETAAQQSLKLARTLLAQGSPVEAKSVVEKMRKDYYLAIDARNEGILLMDSIEIKAAQSELALVDSLLRTGCDTISKDNFDEACRKVQFYERKLQHDKKNNRTTQENK